ncbi:MAG: NADH dehydrogenase subunit [Deltaproteobacteria bacterium CG11_big_fil_rev_8_21_14_0_20_45_16]|nr:MAG: NADH dehydrogenase subunit [Deltaproteobacteria bacterium CG11_big_fil_rev_8_21_14_0_20_45_16]
MAKITINGKEFDVDAGKNLVDAAEENGIEIPHYCYHPGLSIAGQCRMCVVEQEGNPKLQIACNMRCSEGLKVRTDTEKVQEAVKWNLEFHLINHPIDCPICDQAGECGLQDYYMKYGKYQSEMREEKVLKEKAVDLGEKIVLDKERCILCGRCVRFTQEISKTAALGIYNRGDRSVIGTVNDEPMTDNYQVNTVDICPVGALTSKDFRFEQRVWFLDEVESICGGCSKGCNIFVHHKSGKHIYRLKPRYNSQVNEHWMCDIGRDTYKNSNYDRRLTQARLGGIEMPTAEAIQIWAADLKTLVAMEQTDEIGIWLSPELTNEELESVFKLFAKEWGISKFFSENVSAIVAQDEAIDGLLYRKDHYPNSAGFLQATKTYKIKLDSTDSLVDQLDKTKIRHLIIFGPEADRAKTDNSRIANALTHQTFSVLVTAQLSVAESFPQALGIPSLSHLEKSGSLTNHAGLTQEMKGGLKMFREALSTQDILAKLEEEYRKPLDSDRKLEARL